MESPALPPARPLTRRPAALAVLAYLAATLPLLLVNGITGARLVVLVMHVTAAVALFIAWRTPGTGAARIAGDWLPLVLLPLLYAELPFLMPGSATGTVVFRDPVVAGWEQAIFGGQPARTLAARVPGLAVSEVLHFGYLSYYAIVFAPPLLLHALGARDAFSRSALAVMGTFAVCFIVFAVWPVEGPRYRWPAPEGIVDGPVRAFVLAILERGSSRGAAFPSSHAAVAVAQAVVMLRVWRAAGAVVSVLSALLLVGAVYGGFHYAIDMIAGAVLGAVIGALALRGYRDAAAGDGSAASTSRNLPSASRHVGTEVSSADSSREVSSTL